MRIVGISLRFAASYAEPREIPRIEAASLTVIARRSVLAFLGSATLATRQPAVWNPTSGHTDWISNHNVWYESTPRQEGVLSRHVIEIKKGKAEQT